MSDKEKKDKKDKEIRVYQQKVVNTLIEMENEIGNYSTIVELPTGAGKTHIMASYLKEHVLKNKHKSRVLWLTHREVLLEQAQKNISDVVQTKYDDIIVTGNKSPISEIKSQDIVFASIQMMNSVGREKEADFGKQDNNPSIGGTELINWIKESQESGKKLYIIIDEAHHVGADTYDEFLEYLFINGEKPLVRNYALIGLTATPFRADARELNLMRWFKHGYKEEFNLDKVVLDNEKDMKLPYMKEYLRYKVRNCTHIEPQEIGKVVKLQNNRVRAGEQKDFGNTITVIGLQDLIDMGILIEPTFYRVDDFADKGIHWDGKDELLEWYSSDTEDEKKKKKKEITRKEDELLAENIANNIKNTDPKLLGKTLIFVPRVYTAGVLKKYLKEYNIESKIIASSLGSIEDSKIKNEINENMGVLNKKDKKETNKKEPNNIDDETNIFDRLFDKEDELKIIINVDVLSEGFDVPDLDTIILAMPINSQTRLRQRIGRVVRKRNNDETETETKPKNVIWYYFTNDNNKLELNNRSGKYITNNNGYKEVQDSDSVKCDRERKTYYLTAPKYSLPVGYALEYSCYDYKEYINFLEILKLFRDNNENIKDYIGYYLVDNTKIYLNKLLLKGFKNLFHRVRNQWLILRDEDIDVNNIKDIKTFTEKLGISEADYINDIMKICFFLCKPKKGSVFNVRRDNIKSFINCMLTNNCREPKLETIEYEIIQLVDSEIDINSFNNPTLDAVYKKLIEDKDNNKKIEEWADRYKLPEDVIEKMIKDTIKHKFNIRDIGLDEVRRKIENELKASNKTDERLIVTNKIIECAIKHIKRTRIEEYKKKKKKDHTQELIVDGHINYELNDLSNMIKRYRVNWSDKPVKYYDDGTEKVFIDTEFFNVGLGNNLYNKLRLPRKSMITSTIAVCQSILINTHHIGVSDTDAKEYEASIEELVSKLGVQLVINNSKEETYSNLAKDMVCKLGYDLSNNRGKYFKSLLNCYKNYKINIPRYFAYLMYDLVYEGVWREVNFFNKDKEIISTKCQNYTELINKQTDELSEYNLPYDFFTKYNLTPVLDAIYDYKPYNKVLKHYLGIKPEVLCRMMNMIVKQDPNCTHFISGCGGSGAGLINRFYPTSENITETYNDYGYLLTNFYKLLKDGDDCNALKEKINKFWEENNITETYNDYGYLLTNFYQVLKDGDDCNALKDKIKEFVSCITTADSNRLDDEFVIPYYNYFSKEWGDYNDKTTIKENPARHYLIRMRELFLNGKVRKATDEIGKTRSDNDKSVEQKRLSFINKYIPKEYVISDLANLEDDIISRENLLHGVYRIYEVVYCWCQSVGDDDIEKIRVNKIDLAFMVYFFYSFYFRHFFDDCDIENFCKFAALFEQNIEMGHERVSKWNIQNELNPRDIIDLLKVFKNKKKVGVKKCKIKNKAKLLELRKYNIKERLERKDIQNKLNPRDIIDVLKLSKYNTENTITYCDIPYAETDSSFYVSETFKFDEFINTLADFKGKYIVSSRYNICTDVWYKCIYYLMDYLVHEKIDKVLKNEDDKKDKKDKVLKNEDDKKDKKDKVLENEDDKEDREKIIKHIMKDIELTYNISDKVKEQIKDCLNNIDIASCIDLLNNNKELRKKVGLDTDDKLDSEQENENDDYEENQEMLLNGEYYLKAILGTKTYEKRIESISVFYKKFAEMDKNKAKYVVIPYTNTQEDFEGITSKKKTKVGVLRNNYRLKEEDVDIMFKNTIFSNIPVEVMITNVDMLSQDGVLKTEEQHLLDMYKIGDGIHALPTIRAGVNSSAYFTEPIYLVLTYDKYIEYLEKNLYIDKNEREEAANLASYFRDFFANRKQTTSDAQ